MALDVIAVVLVAALLHATWNAMIKGRQTHDPLIGAMVVAAGAAVVSMGVISTVGGPEPASYPYVVASGIIHVGYFLLVGFSYRLADFSAIYPLMRGSAPLITTAAAAWLLEERLGPAALFGIVLLSAGVLGLGRTRSFAVVSTSGAWQSPRPM